MQEENKEVKERININNFALEWDKIIIKTNNKPRLEQLKEFIRVHNIKTEELVVWKRESPVRQENESFEHYKIRMKFQTVLKKYLN